jgi:hypothetical protein
MVGGGGGQGPKNQTLRNKNFWPLEVILKLEALCQTGEFFQKDKLTLATTPWKQMSNGEIKVW